MLPGLKSWFYDFLFTLTKTACNQKKFDIYTEK